MPIHSLSLKNFKCFKEIDVDFSRITLLTGANSSGKSSLIYSILGMLQTKNFPFYYSTNGHFVNMGAYEDIVYKGDELSEFSLSYQGLFIPSWNKSITSLTSYKTVWINDIRNNLPLLKELSYEIGRLKIFITLKEKKYLLTTSFTIDPSIISVAQLYPDDENLKNAKKVEISGDTVTLTEVSFDTFNELFKFIDRKVSFGGLAAIVSIFQEEEQDRFNYISSYRLPPERTYFQKPAASKVEKNGDGYIDQIIDWKENNKKFYNEFISSIADVGLLHDLSANSIEGGRMELLVQTNPNGVLSSLADVGFGVSHFLPIIVADIQLENNSLLAVSQPENDLHPSIQAKFGDYLTKQVKETNKQYIIETHSEYIINRLRLNIAKGELQTENVAIYYLENGQEGSIAHKITFTKDGQIHGAPKGFFETYMMDVMDIALNAEEE